MNSTVIRLEDVLGAVWWVWLDHVVSIRETGVGSLMVLLSGEEIELPLPPDELVKEVFHLSYPGDPDTISE